MSAETAGRSRRCRPTGRGRPARRRGRLPRTEPPAGEAPGPPELLLTPTLHVDPPPIGDTRPWIRATGVFNLTRSTAGSVPVGLSGAGMPVGLQIIGPQHGDVAVLALMRDLERSLSSGSRASPAP